MKFDRRPWACLILLFSSGVYAAETCSYHSYRWNTKTRQAEDLVNISKPYSELKPEEIDSASGCSVCIEDQQLIKIGEMPPVYVCKILADEFTWILTSAIAEGLPIRQLDAYRVGRTRGDVDAEGRRSQFSNHSFGIAIDINSASNGLYENCNEYGEQCVLRRGGEWKPDVNPESISADSLLVELMKESGFKWGGEIAGQQKDFMHFSVSGY